MREMDQGEQAYFNMTVEEHPHCRNGHQRAHHAYAARKTTGGFWIICRLCQRNNKRKKRGKPPLTVDEEYEVQYNQAKDRTAEKLCDMAAVIEKVQEYLDGPDAEEFMETTGWTREELNVLRSR